MAAPIGNKFWMMRSTHGRNPIFANPEALWNAACEYFEWVHDNPLLEEKVFHSQGVVTKGTVCKMRAMTIQALCFFLDISDEAWSDYCNRQDFVGITTRIKKVIYNQKFTGAAADLLNSNIIARELGLSDKVQNEHTGKDGGAIQVNTTAMSAEEAYNLLINGGTIKTD
jgi:hypothetical protein